MKSISLYVAMCVSFLPYKGEAHQQLPPLMSKCCLSDRPQVEDTEPSGEWRCRYTTDTRKAAGRCEEHLKAVQNRSIGTLVALSSQVFAEGSRRCQLFFFYQKCLVAWQQPRFTTKLIQGYMDTQLHILGGWNCGGAPRWYAELVAPNERSIKQMPWTYINTGS